jgi:uncharacterized protein|tara:strand:+ start:497 stop:913 length:417 start_codon:yes stop_codon:yes gene_type:complete
MNIKKAMWFTAGIIFLGIAFVGIYLPGLPWSTPAVLAAYCFSKSSERMHRWLYNHKLFGPFLTGWQEKRIFPTKFKYFMIVTMSSSLAILWFTTGNPKAVLYSGIFMALVAVWGWRYPGSEAEYQRRKELGLRQAWLK